MKLFPVIVFFALAFALVNSGIFLGAFEAHVLNVTAVIDDNPPLCDARSLGYWKNHEGCFKGKGESIWTDEIHQVTTEFAGIFYDITGEQICKAVWISSCPSGNDPDARRCKARAMALAVELNLVSGRLQLDALLAGADDGSSAFDHLGLTGASTIRQAMMMIEIIIGTPSSTSQQLKDAAYVAERIYTFYESENPDAPRCVYVPPPPKDDCDKDGHHSGNDFGTGTEQFLITTGGSHDDGKECDDDTKNDDDNHHDWWDLLSYPGDNDFNSQDNHETGDTDRGERGERGSHDNNGTTTDVFNATTTADVLNGTSTIDTLGGTGDDDGRKERGDREDR
ncbi:MAG: hypothetical protein AAB581_00635 [Patescibacteria group bacterium]